MVGWIKTLRAPQCPINELLQLQREPADFRRNKNFARYSPVAFKKGNRSLKLDVMSSEE